jgi:hypothetical protein
MIAVFLLPEWMIGEKYVTLATWGLVLVTFLLVIATVVMWLDSLSKGKDQKERWDREDEQHKRDRLEERERWTREDDLRVVAVKQEILTDLYSEFCAPDMRRARSRFAYSLFAWTMTSRYETSLRPVPFANLGPDLLINGEQKLTEFFFSLERMLGDNKIEMESFDRKFGDYIFRFVEATSYRRSEKLSAARNLQQKLRSYRIAAKIPAPDADEESRKNYWYYSIERELLPQSL